MDEGYKITDCDICFKKFRCARSKYNYYKISNKKYNLISYLLRILKIKNIFIYFWIPMHKKYSFQIKTNNQIFMQLNIYLNKSSIN